MIGAECLGPVAISLNLQNLSLFVFVKVGVEADIDGILGTNIAPMPRLLLLKLSGHSRLARKRILKTHILIV